MGKNTATQIKRLIVIMMLNVFIFTVFTSCKGINSVLGKTQNGKKETFYKSGSIGKNYVELSQVKDNIWVHTTYEVYNGNRTPSNGVIAVTSKGLVMVDTPWNNQQTEELLKLTKRVFKKDTILAIITHAHADRIGGIDVLLENGISTRSTSLTAKLAEKSGYEKPKPNIKSLTKIKIGNMDMQFYFPGKGHSVDNITVWFPQNKVLIAGCLIKSLDTKDLGNTKDAYVNEWKNSAENLMHKYPKAEIVIPGHGKWGGKELITHTIDLISLSLK